MKFEKYIRFRRLPAILLMLAMAQLHANPLDPTVISGAASFSQQGNTLSVTNSNNAVINWQDFSIGQGELTRFVQPSASSQVLNRVVGGNPSEILGTLQSNGRVFLINPNGIAFGAGAQVDVAGLVASTLNLSNTDFLAGKLDFSNVPGAGNIDNQASLHASGDIILIAPNIRNSGVIKSDTGQILLAAGASVNVVDTSNPDISFEIAAPENQVVNLGQVVARKIGIFGASISNDGIVSADAATVGADGQIMLKAQGAITTGAGSEISADGASGGNVTLQSQTGQTLVQGMVSADGSQGKGGNIHILGNQVALLDNAQVSAAGLNGGGEILVGGDAHGANPAIQNAADTYVAPTAHLNADATGNGDGGKVVVWADKNTQFMGNISARGGAVGGDGGWVEVSGKQWLDYAGLTDTQAAHGSNGSLLLDPTNITISSSTSTGTMLFNGGTKTFEDLVASSSNLNVGTLQTQLASTDVTVSTASALGNLGTITINDGLSWSSTHSLTLSANDSITVAAGSGGITYTGAAAAPLTMLAGADINVNDSLSIKGDVTLVSGGTAYLAADNNITGSLYIGNCACNSFVDFTGGTTSIGNILQVSADTAASLKVSGGLVTVNGLLQSNSANLIFANISAGELTLNSNAFIRGLTLSGGTLDGSGNIGIPAGGTFTWSGGTLAGTGNFSLAPGIPAGVAAAIPASNTILSNTLVLSRPLTNSGNLSQAAAPLNLTISAGGNLTNTAGSTFTLDIANAAIINVDGGALNSVATVPIVLPSVSTLNWNSGTLSADLNNSGLVNFSANGTYTNLYTEGGTPTLTFSPAFGSSLIFDPAAGGSNINFLIINGAGNASMGNTHIATYTIGHLTLSDGKLAGNANVSALGPFIWNGGTLALTNGLIIGSKFSAALSGNITLSSHLTIDAGATLTTGPMTLTFNSAASHLTNNTAGFNLDGTIDLSNGIWDGSGNLTVSNNSSIFNASGGTLGDAVNTTTVINNGTINVSSGSFGVAAKPITLTNNNALNWSGGALNANVGNGGSADFSANGTFSNIYTEAGAATLTFSTGAGSTTTFSPAAGSATTLNFLTVNAASTGTVNFGTTPYSLSNFVQNSGTLTDGGLITATVTMNQTGGTLNASLSNSGTASLGGTTTGNVTNTGALTLNGGTINGTLTNNGTGSVATAGTSTVGGLITNSSTAANAFDVSAGTTLNATTGVSNSLGALFTLEGTLNGLMTNLGTLNLNNGANLTGALTNNGTGSVTTTGTSTVGGLITNNSTTAFDVSAGTTLNATTGVNNNLGGLFTLEGTLNGLMTNLGTLNLNDGANLTGALTNNGTGSVTTTGTSTVGGLITNNSTTAFDVSTGTTLNATTGVNNNLGGLFTIEGILNGSLTNLGTLNLNNGANLTGALTNNGTGSVATAGTSTVGGLITNNSTTAFDVSAGTTLNATTGVNNNLGGLFTIEGTLNGLLTNLGTLNLNNGANLTGTLNNNGTGTVTTLGTSTVGGLITNASTAVAGFDVATATRLNATTGVTNNAGSIFTIEGTLAGPMTNAGTMTQTGTLNGSLTNSGTASSGGTTTGGIGNTGALTLNGAGVTGTLNNTGTGTVTTLGTSTVGGLITNASTAIAGFDVATATRLNATTGVTNNAGSIFAIEGTLAGPMTNAGTMTQTGTLNGSLTNSGTASSGGTTTGGIGNTGALTLNGAGVTGTLNNTGTGTVTTLGTNTVGGLITNASTAVAGFDVATATRLNATTGVTNNAGSIFTIEGTLAGQMSNAGTMTQTGTLNGSLTNSGTASSGGTTTGGIGNTGALTLNGAGVTGTLNNTGTGTVTTLGTSTVGGLITNASTAPAAFDLTAGSKLNGTTGVTNNAGSTFTLAGVLTGNFSNNGILNLTGVINGALTNGASNTTAVATVGGATTGVINGNLTNNATITLTNALVNGATNANNGVMNVNNALFTAGIFSNNSTLLILPGGNLDVSAATSFTQNAGGTTTLSSPGAAPATLTGSGNISINGGVLGGTGIIRSDLLLNGGTLAPGFSPGTIIIVGNLTLGPASITNIQLGGIVQGTDYDFIDVTGTVFLDGTLNALSFGGYTPDPPQIYTFMEARGGITGAFNVVNIPATWAYRLVNLGTALVLAPSQLPNPRINSYLTPPYVPWLSTVLDRLLASNEDVIYDPFEEQICQ